MHQTDLVDTLVTCSMAGHDVHALVFGLQPFDYHTMQVGLTPQAQALVPEFCAKVTDALRQRGIAESRPR